MNKLSTRTADKEGAVLAGDVLAAVRDPLVPRVETVVLRRGPIISSTRIKVSDRIFVRIHDV